MVEDNNLNFLRQLKRSVLVNADPELGRFFDIAAGSAIQALNHDIAEQQKDIKKVIAITKSGQYQQTGIPTEEDIELFENEVSYNENVSQLQTSLFAIAEMRIVNLFKSLEIAIRRLATLAYPENKLSSFANWDLMKNYFKAFGIAISDLEGHSHVLELKTINNQIKHGDELVQDVKKIEEFRDASELTYEALEHFYKRVEQPVNTFFSQLSKAVYEERYEFDDDRISKLAMDFKIRMEGDVLRKFIEALSIAAE
jgi:hypothetical protein